MNKMTLDQYSIVFDSFDKWDALWKIYDESDSLIEPWLQVGASTMREIYNADPEDAWTCQEWGKLRDTRWYLKAHGENSVGFGFGWNEFELHLHLNPPDKSKYEIANNLLNSSEFEVIRARFPHSPSKRKIEEDGSVAWDPSFNPYADNSHQKQKIAWRAYHERQEFAEKMLITVRSIMRDITVKLDEFNVRLNAG
jgi:hypothetical protein